MTPLRRPSGPPGLLGTRSGGRAICASLGAGVAAGGGARLLYALLPEPWNTLANTSALWGLLPFAVVAAWGARGRAAIILGVASLLAMVATWALLAPEPATPRELALWAVVAVGAGTLCGLAGDGVRRGHSWLRRAALAFMGGLVLGEGLYGILLIGGPQWWLECGIGVLLPLCIGRTGRDRMLGLAGSGMLACALFTAYLLYDSIAAG